MMIDSFFNYLFGTSRFLTYILLFIGTIIITYYKALPKTRRTVGAFILQFSLLLVTQIIFYFTHSAQAQREPVLTFVYESYAQDRKSTRLNSSHVSISYAVFCLKKK